MEAKRILIVDDDADIHMLLRKWFEYFGFVCLSAYSVQSALMKLESDDLDLVILDLNFPGDDEDGIDFLRQAKEHLPGDHELPPIIVASCRSDESVMRTVMTIGAVGYISKPYAPQALMAMIRKKVEGLVSVSAN